MHPGQSYTWYPSAVLTISTAINETIPGSAVYLQVIGDDDALFDTGYVAVVVYPAIKAGPDQSVAVGSSVTLSPVISPDVNLDLLDAINVKLAVATV